MSEHAEFGLLDEFVLGTLGAAEAERVRSHLATCSVCRMESDELRSVIDILPHALPVAHAPAELRDRIFAAIDATAQPPRRSVPIGLVGGLAAALVLALGGDAFFALRAASGTAVAVVTPTTAPVTRPTPRPAAAPALGSARPAASPRPAATPSAATPPPRARVSADLAALERELHAARSATLAEAERVRELRRALAAARTAPHVVTVIAPTREPTVAPPTSAPSDDGELVAALRTGKVYAIDGAVDNEPWHLTIVQPRGGAHALLYSGTPDAPSGETYRTWVLRSGQTVSGGELPPGKPATIEMPMALQPGDVIAFSREPVGSGDLPTTAFLMELKITP